MASLAMFVFLFLFLSLQPNMSMANITLSSSLTTNENSLWASPSGDFAFGFRQIDNSKLFLLAIWFNKVPDRTIVWHANGNNPVPLGSRVELTASNLVLMDPKGLTIWEAKPSRAISYGAMLDTGNFVLADNDSTHIWESFKNPTDTILPAQVLNSGDMLSSRLTETNYSKGRFQLHFSDGNLILNPIGWPSESQYESYYSSETYNANSSESGYQLVFNETGNIYITKRNGGIVQLPGWGPIRARADYHYRATLDFYGVFTQYAIPKNSNATQPWWPVKYVPNNICTAKTFYVGSGPCGFNSYCSIQDSKPTCDCPPGYAFMDPNDRFGGCKPTFQLGCGRDDELRDPEELYEIRTLDNVDWPGGDYEGLTPYDQTQCEKSCLQDCSCGAAIISDGWCWKKRLPLSNGRKNLDIGFFRLLLKVRRGVPPGISNLDSKKEKQILRVLFGVAIFFNVLFLAISSLNLLWTQKKKVDKVNNSSNFQTCLHFFTYEEVEEATDGFKEELGRGSFGTVYKGILKSGSRNVIAVKKLDKVAQEREKEFRTEVSSIGKTHHKNLVRLLGYSDEGSHRLLIYEFMSNGTLADFLFRLPRPDWQQRVRIALGIARGLLYLHEECDAPIIHCDIKPQNILLDDSHTPRISDFGVAKLLLTDQTRTHTMIRGTRGYVAPEWFKNVCVTAKVDVYSFGIVLLEIICCRNNVVMVLDEDKRETLTGWVYNCYIQGRLHLLVDNDQAATDDQGRLHNWVTIAIWCIQEDPLKRPNMKMVMEMLEGLVEVPPPPCPSSHSTSF